jgi:purine nucleosidase
MARKVIIDVDPGIDDAVALCLALFDPRLEVVAVTATGGNVPAEQASVNVQTIIEQVDPPRWPRIGAAPTDIAYPTDARHIHGQTGLGDALFNVAELAKRHPSEKVICDEIRAAPEEVTILALGPLTNIARAFSRDPDMVPQVGQLIMLGGTFSGPGNVTAAAEFNMYCDPAAARSVFQSRVTKTLLPIDVACQLEMTYDQADQLPKETRVGRFLEQILPFAFRSHRQHWAMEGMHLPDAVAVICALHPELFETEALFGDVETAGRISTGATVFDRRRMPEHQPNMDVVVGMDVAAVMDAVMRGLSTQ